MSFCGSDIGCASRAYTSPVPDPTPSNFHLAYTHSCSQFPSCYFHLKAFSHKLPSCYFHLTMQSNAFTKSASLASRLGRPGFMSQTNQTSPASVASNLRGRPGYQSQFSLSPLKTLNTHQGGSKCGPECRKVKQWLSAMWCPHKVHPCKYRPPNIRVFVIFSISLVRIPSCFVDNLLSFDIFGISGAGSRSSAAFVSLVSSPSFLLGSQPFDIISVTLSSIIKYLQYIYITICMKGSLHLH